MKNFTLLFIVAIVSTSCQVLNNPSDIRTQGDPKNSVTYGYQPIDPLPVEIGIALDDDGHMEQLTSLTKIADRNKRIMASLPDETMRLAIGQLDTKGNISFSTAKTGYAGSSYIVILDYIKCDTKSLPINIKKMKKILL